MKFPNVLDDNNTVERLEHQQEAQSQRKRSVVTLSPTALPIHIKRPKRKACKQAASSQQQTQAQRQNLIIRRETVLPTESDKISAGRVQI